MVVLMEDSQTALFVAYSRLRESRKSKYGNERERRVKFLQLKIRRANDNLK